MSHQTPWSPNHRNLPNPYREETLTVDALMMAKQKLDEQAIPQEKQVLMVTPEQLANLRKECPQTLRGPTHPSPTKVGTFMGVTLLKVPTEDLSSIPSQT